VREEVSVVLVEGFFDCMKVTQAGFPCVALMGSTMSDAQEELIREHFAHVVVVLDGDEAKRAGEPRKELQTGSAMLSFKLTW
jgi:DNA primase